MNKKQKKGSHPRHRCIGSSDSLRGTADNRLCAILQPLWFPYLVIGYDILKKAWKGNPEQTGI